MMIAAVLLAAHLGVVMPSLGLATTEVAPVVATEVVPVEYAYGPHPQQALDFYLVADSAPTVVMVHGGGFARGDKRRPYGTLLYEHLREVLLAGGFNVISINYRLAADTYEPQQHPWDFKYPTAHEDVVLALQWVREYGTMLGASWPVGVIGESGGGNLAAHVALHPDLDVAAYMDIGGYPDLPAARAEVVLAVAENYIGCPTSACPKLWSMASPAQQAGQPVPMLLWHGDGDTIVDYAQTYALATANANLAWAAGQPAPYTVTRIVEGAGHTGLPGFATPERDAEVLAFFGRFLGATSRKSVESAQELRSRQ